MDDTERRITVFHALHDNPDRKNIIDLIQRLVLVYHLFIDAEEMFHTAIHLRLDVGIFHVLLYLLHNRIDKRFTGTFTKGYFFYKVIINIWFQIFK